MAVAVKQQTLKDSGVSVHGIARRNQRKLDRMQKVSSVLANSPLLSEQSKSFVSNLAKSNKPQATKKSVPLPKTSPKPLEKASVIQPVVGPMPKPVKVEAKKAVAHKQKPKRTERVAALLATPERSLVGAQLPGKTHLLHVQQIGPWSKLHIESYHMAREFDHDRYLNNQDEREVGTILHEYKTNANGKRVKTKVKRFIERNNALQNTLERLATFKSVSHLTDDDGQYEVRHIVSRNNITVGGVRFTLGFKTERVIVPSTSTHAKAEKRAKLDRFESIKSRTFTPAVVGQVTEELEDLPPWQDYALDAVKTAADAIARGYGSLEQEFDSAPYKYEYDPFKYHHIPMGVNVQDLLEAEQVKRNRYMNGLADLPTGAPNYLVDTILAVRSNNDEPEPTTPAPAVAAIPNTDWTALEGDALDAELRTCFQALIDRDAAAYVDGHFSPAKLRQLHDKYGMSYEQWTTTFTERKNRGVLIRQHYDKIALQAKERNAALKNETATRGKVHGYRKKNVFIKMQQKKTFKMMEKLKLSRQQCEKTVESHIQAALQRMEQTYPSDPRNEADRYYEQLEQYDLDAANDRGSEMTRETLQYHLKHMETQRSYDDTFGVVHQSASYRKHKVMPIPKARALTRLEDTIHLDLPPTGAVQATDPVVDKVSQDKPDFLTAGDVVIPFTEGKNIMTEMFSPLKGIMQRHSHRMLFGLSAPMPAFG